MVGTNASGKSGLGVRLAERFNGEIISADSRQIFKGLDLGSGKITESEMHGIKHHLLDVCEPNEFFSMADFQEQAYAAIEDILSRSKLPFIVGGTGLYVDSVADGYVLSANAPDLKYREELETYETKELTAMLDRLAPGHGIDPKNRNRVMRRLERLHAGDDITPKSEPRYDVLRLGVTWPREKLCERIDERLERRMNEGMVDEIKNLMANGATPEFLDKLGLEYRYIYRYVAGIIPTEEEMLDELGRAIKRFAKRQMTWFRKNKSTVWLDMQNDPFEQACSEIDGFIK